MSTYLTSDLHGDLKTFNKILKSVDLKRDTLYILGDVLDRGDQSIELLKKVWELESQYGDHVVMIKGNHELFCVMWMDQELSDSVYLSKPYGGGPTMDSIRHMLEEDKEALKRYINSLPLYVEIDSPFYGRTVLTHSGLDAYTLVKNPDDTINVTKSIDAGYEKSPFEMMCSGDIHRMPEGKAGLGSLDRFMIVGHTPTVFLENHSYEILRKKKYICIDSGGAHRDLGGKQSLYCVDTDEVWYF